MHDPSFRRSRYRVWLMKRSRTVAIMKNSSERYRIDSIIIIAIFKLCSLLHMHSPALCRKQSLREPILVVSRSNGH